VVYVVCGRYLLGWLLLLSSALAVFYGPGYPFWLAPALAFWALLLPGSLPTSTQVRPMHEGSAGQGNVLPCIVMYWPPFIHASIHCHQLICLHTFDSISN
jgi:hypothetical protein